MPQVIILAAKEVVSGTTFPELLSVLLKIHIHFFNSPHQPHSISDAGEEE